MVEPFQPIKLVPAKAVNAKALDAVSKVLTPRLLSKFLGTELNILVEIELLKDLSFFCIGALFFPGFHFKQMKGFPMPADQKSFVRDKQPIRTATFGDDIAYFANIGFKFTF